MHKHLKSALLCGLLVGGAATLSAQAPQQTPQQTQPQTKGGTAERSQGTQGHIKEYSSGQKLVIDVAGAPERSYDLSSKDQVIVVAPGLKAGDAVRIVESETGGRRTINVMADSGSK